MREGGREQGERNKEAEMKLKNEGNGIKKALRMWKQESGHTFLIGFNLIAFLLTLGLAA